MTERDDNAAAYEAVGPDLALQPAAAVLVMGVLALLIIGLGPALLGALVDEHRVSASGLGVTAMLELLSMGVSTALAGAFLKPENLKLIGAGAALLLAAANVSTMHATGVAVMATRAAAGVPEGLLLWITIGMIARSRNPGRWAGIFFTGQVTAQLMLALAFAFFVIPKFGADGGYGLMGLACLIGLPAAFFLPERYGPLAQDQATAGGAPPLRGLIALLATAIYVGANGAVSVYLQPLAHQAGLSADVARTAVWGSLMAQIGGGMLATWLAGRVGYLVVFAAATLGFLVVWGVFALHAPAMLFILDNAAAGVLSLLVGPFLVPMTIEADPSRRAAMQSAGAQLLGAAGGPLLAAFIVGPRDVHGVIWLGYGLLLAGFAVMAWLHFSHHRREPETAS